MMSLASRSLRGLSAPASVVARSKHTLPDLPYSYSALEPVISGEIMELHHKKHHNAYVTNLNVAEEKFLEAQAKKDVAAMVAQQGALKFNGGGHVNHSIFWSNLAPKKEGGGSLPAQDSDLGKMISAQYGSIGNLTSLISAQAVGIQGSGWAWLTFNKNLNRLDVITLPNQDPVSTTGLIPLLGIDVWEHAYYLQYKNMRADYVKGIWDIVNWKNVEQRLKNAQ